MAYSLRIDDIKRPADGSLSIEYTAGRGTLPATWDGTGMRYGSLAQAAEEWNETIEGADEQLANLLLAFLFRYARKRFPDMTGAQFRNAVRGRIITLNLDAAALSGVVTIV